MKRRERGGRLRERRRWRETEEGEMIGKQGK
jgi:hypothetical protein